MPEVPLSRVIPTGGANRIEQLTGLRFVAAMGVLLSHFHGLAPIQGFGFVAELGGHGVTLFFILSGFVLTHRYENNSYVSNIHGPCSPILLKHYAQARFARIVPVYWLALLATLTAYLVGGFELSLGGAPEGALQMVLSFALNAVALQAWVPSESVQQFWNAPGWSISSELFFYACFPLLVQVRRFPGNLRSFSVVFALFSAAVAAYLAALVFTGSVNLLTLGFGVRLPLFGLYPFVTGMLVCRWVRANGPSGALLAKHSTGVVAACVAVLLVTAWGVSAATTRLDPMQAAMLSAYAVPHLVQVPAMALLIAALVLNRGHCARLLASRVMVLLGNASYSLYLFHWLLLSVLLHHFGVGGMPGSWVLLAVGALVALCVAIYMGFEMPMRSRVLRAVAVARAQQDAGC